MHYRNHPQWLGLRGVGNQIIAHQRESQGSAGEIRPFKPLSGKSNEGADSILDFIRNTVSGLDTVRRDVFPNLV